MKIHVQICAPQPEKMLVWSYEATQMVPIPEVGEKIMGYAMGDMALTVRERVYHYMPEQIIVRLICFYETYDNYEEYLARSKR